MVRTKLCCRIVDTSWRQLGLEAEMRGGSRREQEPKSRGEMATSRKQAESIENSCTSRFTQTNGYRR